MAESSYFRMRIQIHKATQRLHQFNIGDRVLVTLGDDQPPTFGFVRTTVTNALAGDEATAFLMVVPDGTTEPRTVAAHKVAEGDQSIVWRPVVVEDHDRPQAGDVVRLDGEWKWAQNLVKVGELGVIDGPVDEELPAEPRVVFHASVFRDDGGVSCSGGPGTHIPLDELKPTGERTTVAAWRFADGQPEAGNGRTYTVDVPVWSWCGTMEP